MAGHSNRANKVPPVVNDHSQERDTDASGYEGKNEENVEQTSTSSPRSSRPGGKKSVLTGARDVIRKLTRSTSSRGSQTAEESTSSFGRSSQPCSRSLAANPRDGASMTRPTKQHVDTGAKSTRHNKVQTKAGKTEASEKESSVPTRKNRRYRNTGIYTPQYFPDDKPPRLLRRTVSGEQLKNDENLKDPTKNENDPSMVAKQPKRHKPPQNPSELDVESMTHGLKLMGFIIEGKLGEGTYAKVRSAYSQKYKKRVALKIISRQRLNNRFQRKFLPRELTLLKIIKHKNIIELYEIIDKNDTIIMVMELARHGDLLEYIQRKKALLNSESRTIFSQVLDAVEYLHFNGIFHRDLKCENVLLNWTATGVVVKLTDFGFARQWSEPYKLCRTYCGSAAYASPEILQGTPYDPHGNDVWSLGVILYIMVTGRMPYDDSNIADSLNNMFNDTLTWPSRRFVSPEVKDLIKSILKHDLKERANIPQIKRSDWMQGKTVTRSASEPRTTGAETKSENASQEGASSAT